MAKAVPAAAPARKKPPTQKQQAFFREYLANGRNASAAYRKVFNSVAGKNTVMKEARALLEHPALKPLLEEADAKAAKVLAAAADRYAVSKERISRELARMAFVDPRRVFEWSDDGVRVKDSTGLSDDDAAAVVEVSQTVTADGGTIRVKLGDRRQALMDLARLHGFIVEPTRNVRVIRSIEDLSDAELAVLAEEQSDE